MIDNAGANVNWQMENLDRFGMVLLNFLYILFYWFGLDSLCHAT